MSRLSHLTATPQAAAPASASEKQGASARRHRLSRDPLVWVVGLLAVFSFVWVALRPPRVFWSLDEGGKFIYLQNVLRTGDPRAPLEYPGRTVDPTLQAVPLYWSVRVGDQLYSWWPVGFSLLSLPFYVALGWLGLYAMPILAGAACAGLAGLLVRQIHPGSGWLAPAAALVTGLATPVAFYSTTFWEHTLSAACLLGAVAATLHALQSEKRRWLLLAGALGAAATWLRTDVVALMGGLLLVLLVWRWRAGLLAGAAFAVGCVPWLLANTWVMGHPITRYWGSLAEGPLLENALKTGPAFVAYALFNAPAVLAYALPTTWLLVGTLAVGLALAAALPGRGRWLALPAYVVVGAIAAYVLVQTSGYRSVHGFVLIAPHVIFAAWLRPGRTRSPAHFFAWAVLAAAGGYGAIYLARGWVAAGGLQWGPRYMLALYPLAVVASLVGVARAWPQMGPALRGATGIALAVCVALGVGYEVRGLAAQRQTVVAFAQAEKSLVALNAETIVTPCTWMPMVLPDLYWTGRVFHPTNIDAWSAQARQAGVRSGYLVDMTACLNIPLDEVASLLAQDPDGITAEPFTLEPVAP